MQQTAPITGLRDELFAFCRAPWDDPAPFYHRLHEEAPVVKGPRDVWIVSRFEDVNLVARETTAAWTRESDGSRVGLFNDGVVRPAQTLMNYMMGFRGKADHDRIRALVSKAFTLRAVADFERAMRAAVHAMIDAVAAKGSMDLVHDLAYPLPITVISDMFGIPPEDRHLLADTAGAIVAFGDVNATERERAHADAMAERFGAMILRHADERRRAPRGDLLTGLVQAEEAGDRLRSEELVSVCFELSAAGHETTANLIGNLVLTLLSQDELWRQVRDDPALIPAAIEEGLRFESPLRVISPRWADRDVEIGGVVIPAGDKVSNWVGAANRDASVFEEPDRFRLDRGKTNRHVGFSAGPHFCLGSALARLEARVALEVLMERLPGLRLAGGRPRWRPGLSVRGLLELPLTWG